MESVRHMSSRSRKSIAYLCIAVVVLAAVLPGVSALEYAVPQPGWVLLPDLATTLDLPVAPPADEQPDSHLSLASPRAPPRPVSS
jgi:hypothetical protein